MDSALHEEARCVSRELGNKSQSSFGCKRRCLSIVDEVEQEHVIRQVGYLKAVRRGKYASYLSPGSGHSFPLSCPRSYPGSLRRGCRRGLGSHLEQSGTWYEVDAASSYEPQRVAKCWVREAKQLCT